MRTKRQFHSLLNRTTTATHKAALLHLEITEAFNERYGATHSDMDADELVQSLDYGSVGAPTVEECDRIMSELGCPPLSRPRGGKS